VTSARPQLSWLRTAGKQMAEMLGFRGAAVGVRIMQTGGPRPPRSVRLPHHRYCQALMQARRGQSVTLDSEGLSCPAAAAAFGFSPLPEGLRNGRGLVGFGITVEGTVGAAMFARMPRLDPGRVVMLHLFPLDRAEAWPDVVVVEEEVEKLMWIGLAYLNASGGERLSGSTAVLQAACVDSTIIPFLENRVNYGYGCYGCREATDITSGEAILGFPAALLPAVVANLEYLASKAVPKSRAKKAWQALEEKSVRRSA